VNKRDATGIACSLTAGAHLDDSNAALMVAPGQGNQMKELIERLITEEDGATLVEYVLLAALIAAASAGAVKLLGANASATYDTTTAGVPHA
jgi:pilus assembly protein Flp/PilA